MPFCSNESPAGIDVFITLFTRSCLDSCLSACGDVFRVGIGVLSSELLVVKLCGEKREPQGVLVCRGMYETPACVLGR